MDYTETFESVAKMDSIRLVLAIATSKGWKVHHMDVKSALLHGELREDIYMLKLEGFHLFVGLRNHFMDSSKPPGLGMQK